MRTIPSRRHLVWTKIIKFFLMGKNLFMIILFFSISLVYSRYCSGFKACYPPDCVFIIPVTYLTKLWPYLAEIRNHHLLSSLFRLKSDNSKATLRTQEKFYQLTISKWSTDGWNYKSQLSFDVAQHCHVFSFFPCSNFCAESFPISCALYRLCFIRFILTGS